MISPQERSDKLIRATDLDALSCRNSAMMKGYFLDPYTPVLIGSYQRYLPLVNGYSAILASRTLRSAFSEPKLPLINRGTYFRTIAIDKVCSDFILQYPNAQIISIGSGSDTRPFRLLASHPDISYVEIDFEESSKIKKLAILSNQELCKIVEADPMSTSDTNFTSRESFQEFDCTLETKRYRLYGHDLRKDLSPLNIQCQSKPTLVISECVLCYISIEDNRRIIDKLRLLIPDISLVIYEPMSLNDSFGSTMASNLLGRGISIPMFEKLPDLQSRKQFLTSLGFKYAQLTSLEQVAGYGDIKNSWIDSAEFQRINRLELIDEIEEITLLLKHYCLSLSGPSENALNWTL